jgi:drug/metabolite transporter (DMT)-like permease
LLVVLLLGLFSMIVIFTGPVDQAALRQEAGWKAVTTMSTTPRLLAIVTNSLGTLLVVGGAVWSGMVFWRKRIMKSRMIGVFLLAGGTLFVALGGTITGLTGLRNHDYLYITMAIGILIMFAGYLQTIRPEPLVTPRLVEAERTQVAG